jgi:hypothetical protein
MWLSGTGLTIRIGSSIERELSQHPTPARRTTAGGGICFLEGETMQTKKVTKTMWTCPSCGKRLQLRDATEVPELCPSCTARFTIKRREVRDEGPGRELAAADRDAVSASAGAIDPMLDCLERIERATATIRTVVVIYFVVNLIGAALLFVAAFGGFLSGLHR